MAPSRAFALVQVAGLVGFAALSELPLVRIRPFAESAFLALWACVAAALVVWAVAWPRQTSVRVLALAALACVGASVWTIRYRLELHRPDLVYDTNVVVTGRVVEPPQLKDRQQEVVVDTTDFGSRARLLIRGSREPELAMGSHISVAGKITLPQPRPGQFDYAHYLEGQGIIGIINAPTQLDVVSPPTGFLGALGSLRAKILAVFNQTLPEPAASLAAGLSIGIPPDIDAQFSDALRRVSLTHLAAVSGQNLTLAVFLIFAFIRKRWLRGAIGIGFALLIVYTVLVGNDPSIIRAAIMASLVFLAPLIGRPLFTPNALLVAANVIAVFNPLVVTRDVGFQLSFMVLGALLVIEPYVRVRLAFLPWGTDRFVAPIVTAAVAALPVQLAAFGTISLVGPLANLLATPLAPPAMGGSMLLAIAGLLYHQLGQAVAWIVIVPLEALHYLAIVLGGWRYSQLVLPLPTALQAGILVAEAAALVAVGLLVRPVPAEELDVDAP